MRFILLIGAGVSLGGAGGAAAADAIIKANRLKMSVNLLIMGRFFRKDDAI
jgi:uncharacterized membrane protein YadS